MNKGGIMGKRAQLMIFVIIAFLIVAVVIVLFLLRSQLAEEIKTPETKPQQISSQFEEGIRQCIRDSSREGIRTISFGGGKLNSELFIQNKDQKYSYLCYTELSYKPCINQDPFLKETFEKDLETYLEEKGKECVDEILFEAKGNGFLVEETKPVVQVNIKPEKVEVLYSQKIDISKEDNKFRIKDFSLPIGSNLDHFIEITNDILNSEAKFGDYDQLTKMINSPGTIINKNKIEGSTLYTIRKDGEEFRFAVRSYYRPPGLY